MNEFIVSLATTSDISGILQVLEHHLLMNKDRSNPVALEQSGFLVTKHSEQHLQDWMNDAKHLTLVCKKAHKIVGYLLSCDWTVMPPLLKTQFTELPSLKKLLQSTSLLYHKQIAIQPGQSGVGSALMKYFFEEALKKGYHHISCIIVHEPILNKVSVDFHKKHGFECVGQVQVDNMRDGVYLKKIE